MDEHRQCGATARTTGQRCRRAAIIGGSVCTVHGGAAGQVRAAADRRRSEDEARRAVGRLGLIADDVDPATVLLREVGRSAAVVDWIGARVAGIDVGAVVTDKGPAPLIEAWLGERQQLVRASQAAIRCGVAQRQVELAEQHGALIAVVLRAVLDDPALGLDDERRRAADGVVHRHLVAIAAGETA